MTDNYLLGVVFALLAGSTNALGTILQKSAVNKIISQVQAGSFVASYVRHPVWVTGFLVTFVFGTIFTLSAQNQIGPALVPALMASGLIFLAFGSARMLNEKLNPSEWIGIISLVIGIALLGFSGLQIPRSGVDLLAPEIQFRFFSFSLALVLCWGVSWWIAKMTPNLSQGQLLAISSGLPFCLSNLWILPLLMTIGLVFTGKAQLTELLFFILSCIILVVTNVLGVQQTQESFRVAPANKVLPLQQVAVQIAPILIYLYVFHRTMTEASIILVPLGVSMILVGGFLLGNRRAEMGSVESSQSKGISEQKVD